MRLLNLLTWASAVAHVTAAVIRPLAVHGPSTAGVEALVRRRLPQHADAFEFTLVDGHDDNDESYIVKSSGDGKVHVQGTTLSALLSGLHAYLSDVAHVDIWWFIGSRLEDAPSSLPKLSVPLNGSSIVPYRYHFNTVTTSYTSAFWTWEDWELQLDWMALRGINLPLAWIGVEKIFIEVFQEIGLTDAEITDFLSGPAFLAWNHFGNIQGSWGGNLPFSWVNEQFALQKKIVQRMVELGMTPILPAFPGYVPPAIARVHPEAKIINGSFWERFPAQYTSDTFLDPFDPVFEKLQQSFIAKQREAYGNITNFYTLDQFNENNPTSGDLGYLRNISLNTWKSLKAADPQAVWVMQGWLFTSNSEFWTNDRVEAFLGGVPENNDMLILDLASESYPQWQRTKSYYGKPWVWCEIHDYGGNMGLYGQILNLTVSPIEALEESKSLVGFGLSMEGQEGNEIMYDLLLDQAWSRTPIDTKAWFHKWVAARYSGGKGKPLPDDLYSAWEILRTTVFNNDNLTANAVPKSIMELVPSTAGLVNRTGHHPTKLGYDPAVMVQGWKHLYQAGLKDPLLFANPSYQYDLVDWTRQVLANAFIPMYQRLIRLYTTPNQYTSCRISKLRTQGQRMTDLMASLDLVLSTNENFRLSTWIAAARESAAGDAKMADFLEYEARNQVTIWGPSGQISDYASKSWSGLVSSYYIPRWKMFVDYLVNTNPSAYNQTEFNAKLLKWELGWVNRTSDSPTEEVPSLETIMPVVLRKWSGVFAA
ncbi:Alpha-N-acetylglucosaminidase [Cladobotryum mycophilum]|uniref:Alpha-N-acetylglucosaminidase n=1 Tax=Cladobotryum mycophilum TaxID=491253 RepID=A0ABR0SVL0_9HYPO